MAAPSREPGAPPWPEVAQGGPGPIYGVFGEEDFLVGQAVQEFLASPAFAQNPDLNIERFYASQDQPDRALESAQTLPFLGTRRLVAVHEAHLYKADQTARFLDYLEDPAPTTTLLFTGERLDSRTRFGKALAKLGKVHVLKKLYANQLPGWLGGRARARGKRLEPEAAQMLAELAGLGLGALDGEVEKLSLFVGERPVITAADAREAVGAGRLFSIFDFTDALAAGNLHRCLTSYYQLDLLGEPAVKVLAMVQRLYKQLLQARQVLDSGGGEPQVQAALRTPSQATKTLAARARQQPAEALGQSLGRILAADVALKSSAGADRVIMERLIMDLCG